MSGAATRRTARGLLVGEALPRRLRLLVLLLVVEIYALEFVPLYDVAGNAALSVFSLVTAIAGGMLGVRGGLFVALVGLLIHALPFGVLVDVEPTLITPLAAVSYALAVLACGVGFGLMQDYRVRAVEHERASAAVHPRREEEDRQRDALTGLPSRVGLSSRLDAALARARGETALLVLDLDRFKDVNESIGHAAGDELIRAVGERLFEHTIAGQAARLGGDEFAVILPETDERAATLLARRLSDAIRAPFSVGTHELFVGASIGIALAPRHGRDAATLLRKAEVAMYVAKRGHIPWAAYAPVPGEPTPALLALTADLRHAIERNELALAFQPIVSCASGSLQRFEALARWPRRDRDVAPSEFVPLADRVGLLTALTDWVITAGVRQLHLWLATGLDAHVSVNLSPRNLLEPDLAKRIAAALEASNVPGSRFGIEVTETTLMADPERAARTISELRAFGVSIAIDDFGSGYSSLSYLHRLPVSTVKIDRSFVRSLATNENARAIVRATVDLAHALDFTVVAEGVEDERTLAICRELGCDQAQGFHIARPLAPIDAARWLRS